ncbi:MAG: TetR/AcrR family transcriptional regulator [Chloroflexi bacterium]|nr:MAG: TetR/AcrR family transcriptional regulator [Chloroflexota bacterium]
MAEETQTTRRRLLDTAAALFFRDGYRAVGVDAIVAESGVSKMTLYRHFASKDELIVAYLQETNEQFWAWFNAVTGTTTDARGQLIAFFAALETLVSKPACYGCPFLNAAVDFPEHNHPGHRISLDHKNAVRARFRDLAARAGARRPDRLADALLLLMDGAFMAVRMHGEHNPAAHVSEAAAQLIDAELVGTPFG